MSSPPPQVLALSERRALARAAKDFAESDRLRDEIAAAGWVVRDGPDGPVLAERPPYDVLAALRDLPDRSAEPDTRRCTVGVLVEGWADDLVGVSFDEYPAIVRVRWNSAEFLRALR